MSSTAFLVGWLLVVPPWFLLVLSCAVFSGVPRLLCISLDCFEFFVDFTRFALFIAQSCSEFFLKTDFVICTFS